MIFDIHVHTKFSHDGKSKMEEYCSLIDSGKVECIGFAEHVDFLPEAYGYGLFDYESYVDSVRTLKDKGYRVYAGAEIDYAKRVEEEIKNSLREKPFDYTICSVHMINGLSVSTEENIHLFQDPVEFRNMMEKYYYELISSIDVPEFDVVGHIGIYKRYLTDQFIKNSPLYSWLDEMDGEVVRECVKTGKIIEVNTSGLFSPCEATFPDRQFLKRYYDCGGRLVTIGSDAHNVQNTSRGFNTAVEILKSIGFKYVVLPWEKENFIGI